MQRLAFALALLPTAVLAEDIPLASDVTGVTLYPNGATVTRRVPFSAPVWTAAITLPDFRGKNQHVNNLEERIAGCFAYSMNGTPPEYGSDEMLALSAYHQWLATGAPMYPDKPIYGRGFPAPEQPEAPSYARGEAAYQENCASKEKQ